jgi:hypothetical protein
MERRDYILRLIQQLGRVLARVRELLAGGQLDAARAELDRTATELGIAGGLARMLTDDSLMALLTASGEPDVAKRLIIAELFYIDALRARDRGAEDESRHLQQRAERLFRSVEKDRETIEALGFTARFDELKILAPRASGPPAA